MSRAFVAVVPPPAVLDALETASREWRARLPDARWTIRGQWHVTLQFLGDRTDLGAVAEALRGLALRQGRVRLGGAGAFPSARRGRVLWLGLAEGAPLLAQHAAAVGALLGPAGHRLVELEERDHHAHLTLARLGRPTDLRRTVEALGAATVGEAWTVREIVLFESRRDAGGARYEVHARFPLAGG